MSQTTAQQLRALKEHPHKYMVDDIINILIEAFPEPESPSFNIYYTSSVTYPSPYSLKWQILEYHVNYDDSVDIISIKRLSDGEVFKIGDLMDYKSEFYSDRGCRINNLTIDSGRIYVNSHKDGERGSEYNGDIDNWVKWTPPKPKPILTTEDGVEIFDFNGFVYGVDREFKFRAVGVQIAEYIPDVKWFSTPGARYEYTLKHKPLFSLNDIISIIYGKEFISIDSLLTKAEELAKSKLSNA